MALTLTSGGRGAKHDLYTSATIAATGANNSDPAPSAGYIMGTVQVVWASITGSATFKLQSTNNGTNWDDIPSATGTTSGAAGSTSIHVSSLPGIQFRLLITSAAGAGTLAVTYALKR